MSTIELDRSKISGPSHLEEGKTYQMTMKGRFKNAPESIKTALTRDFKQKYKVNIEIDSYRLLEINETASEALAVRITFTVIKNAVPGLVAWLVATAFLAALAWLIYKIDEIIIKPVSKALKSAYDKLKNTAGKTGANVVFAVFGAGFVGVVGFIGYRMVRRAME